MVGDARELFWFLYLNNVQESVPREMVAATLRRIGMPEEEFIKIVEQCVKELTEEDRLDALWQTRVCTYWCRC